MTQSNVIDVWMQHPTLRHLQHEMFDPLRRWMGADIPSEALPLQTTIRAMDEGGVAIGLVSAWYGPAGDLISNDEVAAFVAEYPERLRGLAGANLRKPMEYVIYDDELRVASLDFELSHGSGNFRQPISTTSRCTRRA